MTLSCTSNFNSQNILQATAHIGWLGYLSPDAFKRQFYEKRLTA